MSPSPREGIGSGRPFTLVDRENRPVAGAGLRDKARAHHRMQEKLHVEPFLDPGRLSGCRRRHLRARECGR
jgi:hypothetical protein